MGSGRGSRLPTTERVYERADDHGIVYHVVPESASVPTRIHAHSSSTLKAKTMRAHDRSPRPLVTLTLTSDPARTVTWERGSNGSTIDEGDTARISADVQDICTNKLRWRTQYTLHNWPGGVCAGAKTLEWKKHKSLIHFASARRSKNDRETILNTWRRYPVYAYEESRFLYEVRPSQKGANVSLCRVFHANKDSIRSMEKTILHDHRYYKELELSSEDTDVVCEVDIVERPSEVVLNLEHETSVGHGDPDVILQDMLSLVRMTYKSKNIKVPGWFNYDGPQKTKQIHTDTRVWTKYKNLPDYVFRSVRRAE